MKNQKLASYLKAKHNIAVGERTISDLKSRINKLTKTKTKVSGRSYKTGRKKTVYIKLDELIRIK